MEIDRDDFKSAKDVSEYLLKVTGDAMMAGDFDRFAQHFHLPQTVTTFDSQSLLQTRQDVRQIFDNVRAHYRKIGVRELVRYCVAAEFKGPDKIEATHISHLMNGTRQLAEPSAGFSLLHRIEGRWMVKGSQYAIADSIGHGRALIISAAPLPHPNQTIGQIVAGTKNDDSLIRTQFKERKLQ